MRSERCAAPTIVVRLLSLCVTLASAATQALAVTPLEKFYAWCVQSNNLDKPLEHASEYPVQALFVEVYPDWSTVAEDVSLHTRYPKVAKAGSARERAEKLRADLSAKIAKARSKNLDFYLQVGELAYPSNLFDHYPEMRNPDKDSFWEFMADRLGEVFEALPDLAGLVLYLDEAPHKIHELQGGRPTEHYISRLLSTYLRACESRNKRLVVCTFTNYYPERLEALLRAVRSMPHSDHFVVLNWVCPSDWGLFQVLNPAIGRVGGHPEILNFDFSGENWGEGLVPLVQLDFIAERFRNALARGARVVGISGWINWWIPQNLFGTPSEANLYGAPRLLADPARNPETVLEEWLARRLGKDAASSLLPAFRNSFRVVTGSRQVLGFWAMEFPKSNFAPAYWMEYSLRANSPAVWDESFRAVEARLFDPDERALGDMLREKDKAIADAEAALEAVERVQKLVPAPEYEALFRSFRRARDEARALRPYFELYFRYKMWARDRQAARLTRLRELERQLRNWADFFETHYPQDPLRNALRIREYVQEVEGLLSGQPLRQVAVTW